ncbi:MAG: DUF6774 domain-containing protein [Lachnospiraceae bacterium]
MNPCELTMDITSFACQLTDEDLNLAAAIFSQLGDTLTTISVQRSLCAKQEQTDATDCRDDSR